MCHARADPRTFAYSAHGPRSKFAAISSLRRMLFTLPAQRWAWCSSPRIGSHPYVARAERMEAIRSRCSRRLSRTTGISRALRICGDFFLSLPIRLTCVVNGLIPQTALFLTWCLPARTTLCHFFDHEKVRLAFARADDSGPTTYVGFGFSRVYLISIRWPGRA